MRDVAILALIGIVVLAGIAVYTDNLPQVLAALAGVGQPVPSTMTPPEPIPPVTTRTGGIIQQQSQQGGNLYGPF